MQTPISMPAIKDETVTPLQAPLTELQFNAILYAMVNGMGSMMITDQFVIKASDMFELLEMNEQFYKSATSSFMFGMNMDCGHPILTYEEYVEYWNNYFTLLTETQFNGLIELLDDFKEGYVMPEDFNPRLDAINIAQWLYEQVRDCNNPNSIYSDYMDGAYYGKIQLSNYSSYLKEFERRMDIYRKTFKVN